jgi:hypothetical protein
MPHNRDDEISWGIVRAVVMQRFPAGRTGVRDLQEGTKHVAIAAARTSPAQAT